MVSAFDMFDGALYDLGWCISKIIVDGMCDVAALWKYKIKKKKVSEKLFLDIKFKKFILNDEFLEISVLWGLFKRESTPNGECYRYGCWCVIQPMVRSFNTCSRWYARHAEILRRRNWNQQRDLFLIFSKNFSRLSSQMHPLRAKIFSDRG